MRAVFISVYLELVVGTEQKSLFGIAPGADGAVRAGHGLGHPLL